MQASWSRKICLQHSLGLPIIMLSIYCYPRIHNTLSCFFGRMLIDMYTYNEYTNSIYNGHIVLDRSNVRAHVNNYSLCVYVWNFASFTCVAPTALYTVYQLVSNIYTFTCSSELMWMKSSDLQTPTYSIAWS